MSLKTLLSALLLATAASAWGAGLLEQEIHFSESDIQAQVDRNGTLQKSYGNGMIVIALAEAPRVRLGDPAGKAAMNARLKVSILGSGWLPVDVFCTSGVRYDDNAKAFFLENPLVHSVQSASLPREYEPMARQALTQMLGSYVRSKPVYQLREDGSLQERAARWLLRSLRIEPGQVIAVLSAS